MRLFDWHNCILCKNYAFIIIIFISSALPHFNGWRVSRELIDQHNKWMKIILKNNKETVRGSCRRRGRRDAAGDGRGRFAGQPLLHELRTPIGHGSTNSDGASAAAPLVRRHRRRFDHLENRQRRWTIHSYSYFINSYHCNLIIKWLLREWRFICCFDIIFTTFKVKSNKL